jgi:hypothetical protein
LRHRLIRPVMEWSRVVQQFLRNWPIHQIRLAGKITKDGWVAVRSLQLMTQTKQTF